MLVAFAFFSLICIHLDLVNSLNLSICGRSHTTSEDTNWRIVGGTNAAVGEFPWQVIMTRRYYDEDQKADMTEMCGGTIITPQWILTAAHCVMDSNDTTKYMIQLGVHNRDSNDTTSGKATSVAKIVQHEGFRHVSNTAYKDIALIKIKGTIDFKGAHSFLEPICLATSSMSLPSSCVATGFGLMNSRGSSASILQKVSEQVVAHSYCTRVHQNYDSSTNLCAGGTSIGGTGTCTGDSGGPLQCKGSDGRYYQVGITSYGIPCAIADTPDVFTKVSAFMGWIQNAISQN